ncbi:MAG: hypothetical protein LAT83_11820 [Kiritimatiellae bacterium]|nr:hypothetical protein [Kiritimatiellia bacterium]
MSPVWSRSDCVDLGDDRVRPVRLLNAAVTNDPNLKGLVPLSNRGQRAEGRGLGEMRTSNIEHRTSNVEVEEVFANAEEEKRLKWVLGNSPDDRHCPSCSALAGLVLPESTWENAGLRPKSGRLFCGEHCHCRLVETDEAVQENLGAVTALYEGEAANSSAISGIRKQALRLVWGEKMALRNNWSDEARQASIEVRKAKSKKRDLDEDETAKEKKKRELQRIREKLRRGEKLTDEEREFFDKERPRRPRG